jgi:cation diffusion facilitator CzcD-associated flavoprotein CzcO
VDSNMPPPDPALGRLEDRLAEDLAFLELPARPWVPRREGVHDVIVIGAGMCGLAATAKLWLSGIDNIVALDAAPAGQEGPWVTFARMQTLRSPKQLTGPALGLASLTFRAWFTAVHGVRAWQAMDKIPKDLWMDYLVWYRHALRLPVLNQHRMTGIGFDGELIVLDVETPRGRSRMRTRRLVLATGRSGLGGVHVPEFLQAIDRRLWAHSADEIDFAGLKGKRVAVIGAGASGMDNAATALEAGAGSVDVLIRRREMPRINKMTGIGSRGVVLGMGSIPDAWKWRFFDYVAATQTPPPQNSTLRVSRHPNARFFLGCAITGAHEAGQGLSLETSIGRLDYDFLIAATGFKNDFAGRAEFDAIAPFIRTWADGRYRPEMGAPRAALLESPDLGSGFEFREKRVGSCPMLSRIHCFNDAAMLSHGKVSGDIPAVSAGADRLVRHIATALFDEDIEIHYASMEAFATPELAGDEWTDSTPLQTRYANGEK